MFDQIKSAQVIIFITVFILNIVICTHKNVGNSIICSSVFSIIV